MGDLSKTLAGWNKRSISKTNGIHLFWVGHLHQFFSILEQHGFVGGIVVEHDIRIGMIAEHHFGLYKIVKQIDPSELLG